MKRCVALCIFMLCASVSFSQSPSVDDLVSKGIANYNAGNLKTSYELFKQAMKISPNHPEVSRWFWKIKREHDVKNLVDKGIPVDEAKKEEAFVAKTAVEEKKIVAKADITSQPEKPAQKEVVKEIKTVIIDGGKTAVIDKKVARIDEKISQLVEEVKSTRKTLSTSQVEERTFTLSPLAIIALSAGGVVVLFLLIVLSIYRIRLKKIPAPPLNADQADVVAQRVVERLGFEASDDQKLLALTAAKRFIAEHPEKSEKIAQLLTRLSLDKSNSISHQSRLLLEMMKGEMPRSFNELSEPVETYTEGYLLLLQSKYQHDHSRKVRVLAREIGLRMGLGKQQLKELEVASMLQNVGFIRIPDAILNKRSQLTKDEMAQILQHPVYSAEVAEAMRLPTAIVESVRAHHERYNGNGYPARLAGNAIPLYARIIGLCDSFAALTSPKPYRKQITPEKALEILKNELYLFDPDIFEIFLDVVGMIHFSELVSQEALVVQSS